MTDPALNGGGGEPLHCCPRTCSVNTQNADFLSVPGWRLTAHSPLPITLEYHLSAAHHAAHLLPYLILHVTSSLLIKSHVLFSNSAYNFLRDIWVGVEDWGRVVFIVTYMVYVTWVVIYMVTNSCTTSVPIWVAG